MILLRIEEKTASSARLNTEIKNLEAEIAKNQAALDKVSCLLLNEFISSRIFFRKFVFYCHGCTFCRVEFSTFFAIMSSNVDVHLSTSSQPPMKAPVIKFLLNWVQAQDETNARLISIQRSGFIPPLQNGPARYHISRRYSKVCERYLY